VSTDNPSGASPGDGHFFETDSRREALARLNQGLGASACFQLLTGETGTGKTMLVRHAIARWGDAAAVAFVTNPALTRTELVEEIVRRFGAEPAANASKPQLLAGFERALAENAARGRAAAIVIDDAHDLAPDLLGELRLLSNTAEQAGVPLAVILVGLPDLEARLAEPALATLRQRVTAHCHLEPLSPQEARRYMDEVVPATIADAAGAFPRKACGEIVRRSRGVPRTMRALAAEALRRARESGTRLVAPEHVQGAAAALGLASIVTGPQFELPDEPGETSAPTAPHRDAPHPAPAAPEAPNVVRASKPLATPAAPPSASAEPAPGTRDLAPAPQAAKPAPVAPTPRPAPAQAAQPVAREAKPEAAKPVAAQHTPPVAREVKPEAAKPPAAPLVARESKPAAPSRTSADPPRPTPKPETKPPLPPTAAIPPAASTPAAHKPAASTPPVSKPAANPPATPKPPASKQPGDASRAADWVGRFIGPDEPRFGSLFKARPIGGGDTPAAPPSFETAPAAPPSVEAAPAEEDADLAAALATAAPAAPRSRRRGIWRGSSRYAGARHAARTWATPAAIGLFALTAVFVLIALPRGRQLFFAARMQQEAAAPKVADQPAANPAGSRKPKKAERPRLYTLEVGTYMDESLAQAERDRLVADTGLQGWIVTDTRDGATVHRVVVGSYTATGRAETSADYLIRRALVNEAKVIPLPPKRSRR
jgi:general secretion pathway protein A